MFLSILGGGSVLGHEFWISPHDYEVEGSGTLVADIRVGQNFDGSVYSYIPRNFERFELVKDEIVLPVGGRIGDRPALNMPAPSDGLWVVVHETTDNVLTYSEWEKFVSFVEHKDLSGTLGQHADRGLPQTGFRESYRRFAKSLIAVGDGQGRDRVVGLQTEIIAETNPYVDDVQAGIAVRVLYHGQPRKDVQIEVFEKSKDGSVAVFVVRTDGDGRAIVAVKPGHEYLVDSVTMLAQYPDAGSPDPVWRSLWASLTFAVPD